MSLVWHVQWPTQSQLLIALKLADHAHDDGSNVYPAKSTVAKQAQCSESTVQNALRAFRNCGLLRVVQEGGKGPKNPTIYAFNVRMLKTLADARAELVGGADHIDLPEELYAQDEDEKGSTVDPLPSVRGQTDGAKGSTDTAKGSKLLTPNHHLEPSKKNLSAQARENSDLGSEAAPRSHRPAFTLTPADISWKDWIAHLTTHGHHDLAERAQTVGELTASSRWPREGPDEPLPIVPRPPKDITARMIGEGVAK